MGEGRGMRGASNNNRERAVKKLAVDSYSKGSKWLHWMVAIIVMAMLSFSFFLGDVPDQYQPTAYMIHKSLGLTVLFLMCARLFWIVHTGRPELPFTVPMWERVLTRVVQTSMYILLFAMPVVGWVMSVAAGRTPIYFGLFDVPLPGIPIDKQLSHTMANTHEIIAWILIVLISLHILGALKHYFINKDRILHRMLGDLRKNF